jgi:hypothetical protein
MIITPYLSHFTQLHPAAVVPSWRKERGFPEFRSLFDPALSENLVNYPSAFWLPIINLAVTASEKLEASRNTVDGGDDPKGHPPKLRGLVQTLGDF